jgi:hypothetical protein
MCTLTRRPPVLYTDCAWVARVQLPLWLVFQNADRSNAKANPAGQRIYTILKAGDDLRQDMLTLQMITLMDKVRHLSHAL